MNERSRKIADSLSEIRQTLNSTLISQPAPHTKHSKPQSKPQLNNLEANVSTVVDQHEDILNHLTRQVNCYKESLAALRDRCEVLVNQNQALHKELEQHINLDVTELAGQCTDGEVLGGEVGAAHANLLEQLMDRRGIYEQQISTLERQVSLLKAELKDSEYQRTQMKSRSEPDVVECERCRDTPASQVHSNTVTRLEQEKQELEIALMSLQNLVEVMKKREDEALGKVKKSVEMVDKVKSDQETLEMKLKRSTDELNRVRERHQIQITQAKAELQQHHDEAIAELRDKLHGKERELTESLTEIQKLQLQIEAGEREKRELQSTVERYREQGLTSMEVVDKTSQQLRDQLRAALQERDEAISQLALNKNNVQLELHDRQREVTQLQGEIKRYKDRAANSEETVRKLTLDSATLHDEIANLKINMNKVHNEKISMEKTNTLTIEHLKLVSTQAQQSAKSEIEELRARHSETVAQLHKLLQQQQSLANKWRTAHGESIRQFEESSKVMSEELTQTKKSYHLVQQKLESSESKVKSLTSKNKTLKETEKKMSKSLKLAESHIIKTAEELYGVVQKKNNLMRERAVMAKEINLLQTQLCDVPTFIPKPFIETPVPDTATEDTG